MRAQIVADYSVIFNSNLIKTRLFSVRAVFFSRTLFPRASLKQNFPSWRDASLISRRRRRRRLSSSQFPQFHLRLDLMKSSILPVSPFLQDSISHAFARK